MRRALAATLIAFACCVPPAAAQTVEHGIEVLQRDAAALTADHEPAVAAYEQSWTHRALAFQQRLSDGVPLRDAPWVGTHNSFNSIAEMGPALSVMDANQQLSLVHQLRVDVRSLELDLHWFPSASGGGMTPVVCHAQGGAGCSVEKPLADTLPPIAQWLRAHPGEVLLLYLENQLRGEEGSNAAAAVIEDQLGDLLYRPSGAPGECVDLPLDRTRADILAAGRQVAIVSNCGAGAAWRSISFGWSTHKETRPRDFSCHADFDQAAYDATIVRYFEDDTFLTSAASNSGAASRDDGIDAATARAMTLCGVDLLGFDHLAAGGDRHDALVWSWAAGEDVAAPCAAQRPEDGRWVARPCGEKRPFVCRSADGAYGVTKKARGDDLPAGCGAPRTGYENERARSAAAGRWAWIALP